MANDWAKQRGQQTFCDNRGYERFSPRQSEATILEMMSQPTLTLSPHELYFLPPATPATAPATRVEVEVDGKMRVFLARSEICNSRARNRSAVTLFYKEDLANGIVFGGTTWLLKIRSPKTADEIRESVKHLAPFKSVNRYWRAPDAAFGVSYHCSGRALLHSSDLVSAIDAVGFQWAESQNAREVIFASQDKFLKFCH